VDKPDPTDYFVMGIALDQLKRYEESVDALQKCVQIPGKMQDRCKQLSEQVKKQAASEPAGLTPPKQ
jgi:hypothetical protein